MLKATVGGCLSLVWLFFADWGVVLAAEPAAHSVSLTLQAGERTATASSGQTRSAGRAQWQAEIEEAKADRSKGIKIALIGGGAGAALALLLGSRADSGQGPLLGMLVSAGSIGYGGLKYMNAKDRLEDLDREGRTKGYITLIPLRGGVAVAATLRF